jgi:metallo-beta-lactamase class B
MNSRSVPRARALSSLLLLATFSIAPAAQDPRAEWNAPQAPFRVFGNTYYVGPRGVSSVLVTSDAGHVLLDGGLPESVPAIVSSIQRLGFRIEDVKVILNSHVHYDHAGGIGELQRLSGATVAARAASATVFRQGRSGPDDPQFGLLPDIARVEHVRVVSDGEKLRVGPLELTAHATGGHTPGGTSWSWTSCEEMRCVEIVYADSLTAVSADGFSYTRSRHYSSAIDDFERGFTFLSAAPCDILLTPHPGASDLLARLAKRESGDADALIDPAACRRYAERGRAGLRKRVESERTK